MALNKGLMSSNNSEWETPNELFNKLNQIFKFGLDAAATKDNTKCLLFITPEQDALKQDWGGRGPVWINPPYERYRMGLWLNKIYAEAQKGVAVVALLPARTETRWFQTAWRANHLVFVRGRIKFIGGKSAAPFPSVIAIFGKKLSPAKRRKLEEIGKVITP
jgi:phage N-6-adenine-methyltransferase